MLDKTRGMSGDGRLIWKQISTATKMACGARDAAYQNEPAYIQFTVANGRGKKIQIMLNPSDLYDVAYIQVGKKGIKTLEEASDVFVEDLNETIYRMVNK